MSVAVAEVRREVCQQEEMGGCSAREPQRPAVLRGSAAEGEDVPSGAFPVLPSSHHPRGAQICRARSSSGKGELQWEDERAREEWRW